MGLVLVQNGPRRGGTGLSGRAPPSVPAQPRPRTPRGQHNPRPPAADNHPGRQRQLGQRWSKFNPVLTGRHTGPLRVRTKTDSLRPNVVGTAILWRRGSQSTGLAGQTSRVRTVGKRPPPDHDMRASDGRTLGRRQLAFARTPIVRIRWGSRDPSAALIRVHIDHIYRYIPISVNLS